MEQAEWFKDWFDSPYYHLLYNKRNLSEAEFFIENLVNKLQLAQNLKVWDLACGKGRHAVTLNKYNLQVTGTDLSRNSISEAKKNESDSLDFFVHDMRLPFRFNYFDAVFNLFTSIGYFENRNDNFKVFDSVYKALKPNGVFLIDFLNQNLISCNGNTILMEQRENITFKINKRIEHNRVLKKINFEDGDKKYYFEEKVDLLKKSDFLEFATSVGFKLVNSFGNYSLDAYNESTSERLILLFKK